MTQQFTHPIKVGVQLHPQHTTYKDFADAVRRAEDLGVDSIWNWDHFSPMYGDPQGNHFESWTLLTAMATLTTRAQIGCLVTGNTYRNPALLANMAKTVDHISDGRLILGIGAGWHERDYKEYGYDFGTAGSRLAALEESLVTIKHRWEIDMPKPIHGSVPILIGGNGEKKTLRITAKYADMWNGFGDPETIKHKMQVLDEWCAKEGRNPSDIQRTVITKAEDSDETHDAFIATGVSQLIIGPGAPWDFPTLFPALERLIRWRDSRNK